MIDQFAEHPWPGDTAYLFDALIGDTSTAQQIAKIQAEFNFPELVPVLADELHITVQPVAFEGAITDEELTAISVDAARIAEEINSEITFLGPITVDTDQVVLLAKPCRALHHVRSVLRESVLRRSTHNAMSSIEYFRPHVSMFYSVGDHPTEPVDDLVAKLNPVELETTIDEFSLVKVTRADGHYRNEVMATFHFGKAARAIT